MTLLGVFRSPTNPANVAEYEDWVDRQVDVVLSFVGRGPNWNTIDNPNWYIDPWRQSGKTLCLSTAMLPNTGYTLEAGARGDYDSHWVNFFRAVVAGGDIDIRLGWEFNGKFYPWAAGGKEVAFASYWRRIVDIARRAGFRGKFIWCPLGGNANANVEACWPGAGYVDVIGIDYYDTAGPGDKDPTARWQKQWDRQYGGKWAQDFSTAKGLPLCVPEWGLVLRPDGIGLGDNPHYIRKMYEWFAANPNLKWAAYFEDDESTNYHRLMTGQFPESGLMFLDLFDEAVEDPVPDPVPVGDCSALETELAAVKEDLAIATDRMFVAERRADEATADVEGLLDDMDALRADYAALRGAVAAAYALVAG